MKILLKFLLATIIVALIIILIVAFMIWDTDINNWSTDARAMIVILSTTIAFAYVTVKEYKL